MIIIIDAPGARLGYLKEQKISWQDTNKEQQRLVADLQNLIKEAGCSLKEITHIFVVQEGATFSDARSAVVLANSLVYSNKIPATLIKGGQLEDLGGIEELAVKNETNEPKLLEVQYSAPPSITRKG